MELLSSEFHYIVVDGDYSLWINRQTAEAVAKTGAKSELVGTTCLGVVYGYLGKVKFGDGFEPWLVFVKQRAYVGVLKGCDVFKIISVLTIPIGSDVELVLEICAKHAPSPQIADGPPTASRAIHPDGISSPATFEYTGQKNVWKVNVNATPNFYQNGNRPKGNEKPAKMERKILEEFHKMFTEADSFYYSHNYDLTNSIQRQYLKSESRKGATFPLWYNADSRFMWNHFMLNDLIQSKKPEFDRWIIPLVQGFVESCKCEVGGGINPTIPVQGHIEMWLISRRSRFRAGTRYLRRGIDEKGKVANYVETEQILVFKQYITSFVQTRGSIPLFWSQPGFRYRPPPQLDRSEQGSYAAFKLHITEEGSIYGPLTLINLVDKTGKEKVLSDAYLSSVLTHNSPDLVYLSFDFHEHCRGMRFENVKVLIDKLDDSFNKMNYCWVDAQGIVQKQNGVFRVNCVDCLDRTNVVQTSIGKHMLQVQLGKLGLIAPEIGLDRTVKLKLQTMWANNGDCISKQYAGTNALKGDFTRTGTTKLTSALKDGMNSANRYYLNRFRDVYRQAAIDLMLGERKSFTVEELELDEQPRLEEKENTMEQIKAVIEDAKKCLVPKHAVILGSWGLVNARNNTPDEIDIDTIFILTDNCYFSAEYDCNIDSITETEMVNLKYIRSIQLGFENLIQPSNFWSLFGTTNQSSTQSSVPCLRVNYKHAGDLHCHEYRSSNIRFFNNVAVPIAHPEEMLEALKMMAESIQIAAESVGNKVDFHKTDVLPPRPVKVPTSIFTTSWVHRYFNLGQELDNETESKKAPRHSVLSFDRFTPKYFRKPSAANNEYQDGSKEIKTTINPLKFSIKRNSQKIQRDTEKIAQLNINGTTSAYSQNSSRSTPTSIANSGDLVLPSCGVLSFSQIRHPNIDIQFNGSRSPENRSPVPCVRSNYEIANTLPLTPASPKPFPSEPDKIENDIFSSPPSSAILSRHRLSLPAQAIQIHLPSRSVTPEIMITEDTSQILTKTNNVEKSVLNVPLISKRMSRSTEEITSDVSGDEVQQDTLLCTNLSSSTQSLTNTAISMKPSRSENVIGRRIGSVRGSSAPLRKEVVLVPLGKLARGMQKGATYFDPRKLKDTFKPQLRKDNSSEVLKKEEKEYNFQLEERKRKSKSVIIEI